jgi:DnaK suppressor protein
MKFPAKVLQPVQEYLEKQRKKLIKRKKDLAKEDPFFNTDRVNDNAAVDTEAAEEADHERVSALSMEINRNLARVRKALTRIKIGKYGMCVKCGKMIDTDRLAIDPTAEFCIKCQQKQKPAS